MRGSVIAFSLWLDVIHSSFYRPGSYPVKKKLLYSPVDGCPSKVARWLGGLIRAFQVRTDTGAESQTSVFFSVGTLQRK